MELIFENEGITWLDFFRELKIAYGEDMRVTRLDLAIDELYQGYEKETEQFLLSDMITKYYHKELDFNSMRTWNYIGGGSLNFEDEQEIEEIVKVFLFILAVVNLKCILTFMKSDMN